MEVRSLAWLSCLALVGAETAMAQEVSKDIVATAVRERGYECDDPERVKPDPEHTAPDEKAWIIRCESRSYRVKFMGDRGA